MGRPKLPQTKEQIAIRLAPGTKARLSALIRSMQAKGIEVPLRSEVLRKAIERGIEEMEADILKGGRSSRGAPRERVASATTAAEPARSRPVPPPPHMPQPSAVRSPQPARTAPRAEPAIAAPPRERAVAAPPARIVTPRERPAVSPPAAPRERAAAMPPPAPTAAPRERAAAAPTAPSPKKPATAPSPAASSGRRGPIPGTLADRALRQLKDMGGASSQVAIPALCRAAWPPNPARVHEALRELRELGLVDLVAASSSDTNDSDHELILTESSGARFGFARLR